jgi:hypothetical protein
MPHTIICCCLKSEHSNVESHRYMVLHVANLWGYPIDAFYLAVRRPYLDCQGFSLCIELLSLYTLFKFYFISVTRLSPAITGNVGII